MMSKTKHNTAFVIVSGNDPDNKYCTKENIHRFKVLFKNGDLFHIDFTRLSAKEEFIEIPDIFVFVKKLAYKYDKLLFYYTGIGESTRTDDIPAFKYNKSRCSLHELKGFCERLGFILSIIIFDCCIYFPTDSVIQNKVLFTSKNNMIRSFSVEQLNHLMNKRGHITISASKKNLLSHALPEIGGIFSCLYLHFINLNWEYDHVFLESIVSTNNIYEEHKIDNSFCDIKGFLISVGHLEQIECSVDQFKIIDFSIPDKIINDTLIFFK